ncbi:KLHL8-like protein [Mya arenaria]|uniref:KLHL8-like protein n=1 Tax=Mya arenaria TaxID=6604 RepID=A0ABY7E1N8_MYAAR|nr:KLHL8-like protein [Mya arenaria]
MHERQQMVVLFGNLSDIVMEAEEGDAMLGEHFVQSLSRQLPVYQQDTNLGEGSLSVNQGRVPAGGYYSVSHNPSTMAPPSHQHHVNMHTSSNALYQGPLSPNSIPQNLTKSQTQAEVSASHTKSDLAQKIALLPLGNSGTDFLPVRWGHLAANLPNLAARLASPRGDNSSPQPLILNTSTAGLLRKHLGETEFLSSNQFEHYSENYLGNKELSQSLDIHDMGNEARTSDKDIFNNPSVSEYAYSLMSSSVQENTNIPVYKSKLEKAIAQNQLSKLKAETQSQLSHLVKSSAKESIDSTNALENVLTASSGISGSLLFKKYSDSASRLNDFPNVNEPTESIQTQIQQMPLSSITRNIEIKQIKKPALMKKQLAIQPKPPSNPLVAPVVEPAETYHILRSEPPAAASEPEPVYLYVTRPDVPKEQPPPIITEKKYNDYGLASDILKNLWKLREEGKYCDAVLFCGKNFVRAHRLVLLASSPELQKKSADCSESELKLVLPEGIQEESVEAFLAFLYNGNITLTVDNVQQIYRIALIFSIDAVVRYCYDFCKEAKLGHLIISVPYLETAVHVHLDRVRMDETNLVAKRKLDAAKKKSRMQTVDNLKSPVKQEVMNTSIANLEYDVPLVDKMIVDGDLNQSLGMKSKDQMGNERVEGNMKQRLKKDYTLRRRKDKSSDKQDISKVSATFKPIADTQANNDTIEGVGKELSHDFTLFPDPLVTGKLDEDELRKSDNLCEVIEERTVATDNETTVSRFRKRPSNISLLEAAEQKKAKSNDTSALFITSTSSSKKPKAKGRKSPKSKPGTSVNQVQAHNPDDLAALNKNLQQKVQSDHGIEMIVDPVESYSKSLDGLKDYEGVGQNKVVSTIDGTHLDLESTGFEPQTKKGIPKKIETAEKTTYTSPPKKARNRSGTEHCLTNITCKAGKN